MKAVLEVEETRYTVSVAPSNEGMDYLGFVEAERTFLDDHCRRHTDHWGVEEVGGTTGRDALIAGVAAALADALTRPEHVLHREMMTDDAFVAAAEHLPTR
jgi:hypothetical protein